ncbi:DUF4307 domain-containing protein [Kitasatospora sp. NBC_01287]|uniref:DUF4307 domain-containing protein n=1 Tax=Kitasatospora sp. NBC_01287 TaxID=2903573 RepID=UPI0022592EA7|nr:DUF4307 domain-containing protein [Kitasatospora sp. NBC_01287]MCX4747070.1 DUF4307 domain-containing protein [Kitasatospora sp. NBC_01287]
MTATSSTPPGALPQGRYGRRSDQQADRSLKVVGLVLAVLVVALVAWFGSSYIETASKLNGTVPTFQIVSDSQVQAELSVLKDSGVGGTCTIRSQAADGSVVGMLDVPVPTHGTTYVQTVTIRTNARGTTAELMGCTPSK